MGRKDNVLEYLTSETSPNVLIFFLMPATSTGSILKVSRSNAALPYCIEKVQISQYNAA